MSHTWERWSKIILCERCGRTNPSGIALCLNCGQQIGTDSSKALLKKKKVDPFRIRPYTRAHAMLPFVAQRAKEEIDQALTIIREENIFSWVAGGKVPGEVTDEMIADAESTIRLRLPASLLAILKMQNGGVPYNDTYASDSCPLPLLHGIAPGSGTHASLQEMPQTIWDVFETFLDEDFYLNWWATLNGKIHPFWGEKPSIPETILLIAEDLHWGIGLNYVACGPQGEPSVVHVEMEGPGPEEFLRELAPDFMTFLRGLYHDDEDEDVGDDDE